MARYLNVRRRGPAFSYTMTNVLQETCRNMIQMVRSRATIEPLSSRDTFDWLYDERDREALRQVKEIVPDALTLRAGTTVELYVQLPWHGLHIPCMVMWNTNDPEVLPVGTKMPLKGHLRRELETKITSQLTFAVTAAIDIMIVRDVFEELNKPGMELSSAKLRYLFPAVLSMMRLANRTFPESDPRRSTIQDYITRLANVSSSAAGPIPPGMANAISHAEEQVHMVGLMGDEPAPEPAYAVGYAYIKPHLNFMIEHPCWPGHELHVSE